MIRLTEEQKAEILKTFAKTPNLMQITRKIFDDESLDGRSQEGRAVRSFLASQKRDYDTQKSEAKQSINLTEKQKEFLMGDQVNESMIPLEIARTLFEDARIKPLSKQHRVILEFLKKYRPSILDDHDILVEGTWHPPKSMLTCLQRVNKWCHTELGNEVEELNSRNFKYIERLLSYYQNFKLNCTINTFNIKSDRELFESEFVRATWNKPDLTSDEINLYMMVCSNFIRIKHIQSRLDRLNNFLNNQSNENEEPSIRIVELIKATNDELNSCEKRVETLTSKLNGDRSKRIEKQLGQNANFLVLVNEFQAKESRDRLVKIAEMQNQLVSTEADRLESMDDVKARIFGVNKDELL